MKRLILKRLIIVCCFFGLAGCVSNQFKAVVPGTVQVGDLTVEATDASWNKAPQTMTWHLHKGSQLWTRDGLLLDYMVLIPGVSDGGTLFKSRSKSLVYPAYQAGMLPNEIVELTESSLAKLNGTDVAVSSSHLRPFRLGAQPAVMFDLTLIGTDGPSRRGRAVAFVQDESLYLMLYVGTQLHYFDKHWDSALATMNTARLSS
jgi:hypothetical protein